MQSNFNLNQIILMGQIKIKLYCVSCRSHMCFELELFSIHMNILILLPAACAVMICQVAL